MNDFLKQYGGWIVTGILVAVILYLIFRPVPSYDNTDALKRIDSLTTDNNNLRTQLTNFAYQGSIREAVLDHKNDSLRAQNDVLKFKNDVSYDQNVSLANQVQYYKAHQDIASYDSACDLLAYRVISDSILVRDLETNTDALIASFDQEISMRDSLITFQSNLIVSDSTLISQQRSLVDLQQKQLKKSVKQGKMVAWLARSLAVTSLVLAGILMSK